MCLAIIEDHEGGRPDCVSLYLVPGISLSRLVLYFQILSTMNCDFDNFVISSIFVNAQFSEFVNFMN